jgi:hypothetical protein
MLAVASHDEGGAEAVAAELVVLARRPDPG